MIVVWAPVIQKVDNVIQWFQWMTQLVFLMSLRWIVILNVFVR